VDDRPVNEHTEFPRHASLGPDLPKVCRLGLATRGGTDLRAEDAASAIEQGVNYLNWCGKPDGLSRAIAALGVAREKVVIAVQFQARDVQQAGREFERLLDQLNTTHIDILTLYYVESENTWRDLIAAGGVLEYLNRRKEEGLLRRIGLTTHQRKLAAQFAGTGLIDLLMIRYNAAHRGAEEDIFPVTRRLAMPVVTFTGLRWRALLEPTPGDPPGFKPPAAAECYRFCLAHPDVSVALQAPNNRAELNHNLKLLHDWRPPAPVELQALREHGDRVHRCAREFW